MSEPTSGPAGDAESAPGQERPDAEVGSLGQEAARLFEALSGWAGHHNGPGSSQQTPPESAAPGHGLADAVGDLLGTLNTHLASGGEDCRYCPVCRMIQAVRETSPEVREQVSDATRSLLHTAADLLATRRTEPRDGGVERIDLSDDGSWEDER